MTSSIYSVKEEISPFVTFTYSFPYATIVFVGLCPLKFSYLLSGKPIFPLRICTLTIMCSQITVALPMQDLCGFNFINFLIHGYTDILFQLVSMALQRIILSEITSNKTAYNFLFALQFFKGYKDIICEQLIKCQNFFLDPKVLLN